MRGPLEELPLESFVTRQVGQIVRSWPHSLGQHFRHYVRGPGKTNFRRLTSWDDLTDEPFWLSLLRWMVVKIERDGNVRINSSLQSNVCFAQTCLGLFVRIHDDLADGNAADPVLPVVAHQFLIEAERALASHLAGDAAFWAFFRDALEETAWNSVRVAKWERSPSSDPKKLRRALAAQAAVLGVGAAAVCYSTGQTAMLPEVRRFGAAMTVAGQALDDLRDLDEDLAQGKVNLAANLMLRAAERAGIAVELTRDSLAESAVRSGGFQDILDLVARQLARAKAAARRLELPEAVALVERYQGWPRAMKEQIHLRRADALFASIKR